MITVSIYSIGDSEVIVPQRVESERRLVDSPRPPGKGGPAARTVEGVEDFDASIAALPAQQQAPLKRLRDWAVNLVKSSLIKLQTVHSKTPGRLVLNIRLVDEDSGFATIYNNNGTAALQLWGRALKRRAPKALEEIEQIVAPQTIGHGTYVNNVSQELLDALSEAYN